jgi:hypothetical protein
MIREEGDAAVPLRTDFSAGELRQLARQAKDADQARGFCRWQSFSTG